MAKLPFPPTKKPTKAKTEYTADEFQKGFVLKAKKVRKKQEDDEQLALCLWLSKTYPNAVFISDIAGRPLPHTVRNTVYKMRSRTQTGEVFKQPDLVIYNPAKGFVGLMIEIKKTGEKIYKRDGELIADSHVQRQAQALQFFRSVGWNAVFSIGIEACKEIIINHFKED